MVGGPVKMLLDAMPCSGSQATYSCLSSFSLGLRSSSAVLKVMLTVITLARFKARSCCAGSASGSLLRTAIRMLLSNVTRGRSAGLGGLWSSTSGGNSFTAYSSSSSVILHTQYPTPALQLQCAYSLNSSAPLRKCSSLQCFHAQACRPAL